MVFDRSNIGYFIAFMLIGAIFGSAIGTLLSKIFPAISIIKESLTGPIGFNLEIVSFSFKLNLSAIFGIILGIFVFRKI